MKNAQLETTTLDRLLEDYSRGEITRRQVQDETELWFGNILYEMGKRNLPLPTVDSTLSYTPKQMDLYNKIFKPSFFVRIKRKLRLC